MRSRYQSQVDRICRQLGVGHLLRKEKVRENLSKRKDKEADFRALDDELNREWNKQ